MKYILDTDTLAYIIQQDVDVLKKFSSLAREVPIENIVLTIISHAEMHYGYEWAQHRKKQVKDPRPYLAEFPALHFTMESLPYYASIKADLREKGALIGELDLMIAAIALQHGAILITSNIRDFERIEDLKIENWKSKK